MVVEFQIGATLEQEICFLKGCSSNIYTEKEKQVIQKFENANTKSAVVSLEDVLIISQLSRRFRKEDGKWVHELLNGSNVHLPAMSTKKAGVSEKSLRLKREHENREYRKIVKNIVGDSEVDRMKENVEMKAMKAQLSMGLNVIIAMATGLTVGYWIGKKVFGSYEWAIASGVFFMIGALVLDVSLLLLNIWKVDKLVTHKGVSKKKQSKILENENVLKR